jgi:hypothetical protein
MGAGRDAYLHHCYNTLVDIQLEDAGCDPISRNKHVRGWGSCRPLQRMYKSYNHLKA